MSRIMYLVVCFSIAIGLSSYTVEIDYTNCESVQDVIAIEPEKSTTLIRQTMKN